MAPRSMHLAGYLIATVLLNGCAWVHQDAALRLEPAVSPSKVGNGAVVAVRVIDRRPTRTIGFRGVDSKNATITTSQDVAELFHASIVDGLTRKGFTAVSDGNRPQRLLSIEIRQIEYKTDMEFFKGLVKVETLLNATCLKDGARFNQAYRGNREETTLEAPGAKTNERLINGAISDAVQSLLEDDRLIGFLADRAPR
jgi:uncharacterized lipoprotein YajG